MGRLWYPTAYYLLYLQWPSSMEVSILFRVEVRSLCHNNKIPFDPHELESIVITA